MKSGGKNNSTGGGATNIISGVKMNTTSCNQWWQNPSFTDLVRRRRMTEQSPGHRITKSVYGIPLACYAGSNVGTAESGTRRRMNERLPGRRTMNRLLREEWRASMCDRRL